MRALLWAALLAAMGAGMAPVVAQDGEVIPETLANHDTNQPIDITADTAEIRHSDRVVLFEGSVRAAQGVLTLESDRLTARFDEAGDRARRVEARGSVVIRSARRSASGEWAVYDVAEKTVTMGGPVSFTQDNGDRLTADRLIVDLDTGLWQFEGTDAQGVSGSFAVPDDPE